jgi:uncharacterized caspase-like protein
VSLTLFGAAGYGRLLGGIAKPFQIMQALVPVELASIIEHASDAAALAVAAARTLAALACLAAIRRPQ